MKPDDFAEMRSGVSVFSQPDPSVDLSSQFGIPSMPTDRSGAQQIGARAYPQQLAIEDLIKPVVALERQREARGKLSQTHPITINTLGHSTWEIRNPLHISVEQHGEGEFVACLYDVDLYGYGKTIPDAIDDLKTIILDQFEYLSESHQTVRLGAMPKKQFEFLDKILVRTDA